MAGPLLPRLKIGFVLDNPIDKPDGVQQYVQTLGRWLSSQGHEVHYLVGVSEETDLKNVHSLPRNMPIAFNGNRLTTPLPVSRKRIRALLKELDLDVLHLQTPHSPFFGQRVVLEASSRTAVVATFHILPYTRSVTAANKLLAPLLQPSLKRLDALFAVSEPAKQFAEAVYKIPAMVLPNPIRLEQFEGARGFDAYADLPTIVCVGRLVRRKGTMWLLRAIDHIRSNRLYDGHFRVLVCGKGEERNSLDAFITERGLQNTVTMLGYITEADKPRYIASSDIAVFPSVSGESFGIVLLEGMAASKGVVLAGNNPGYASVMGQDAQQLFDPRDTAAFAALLVRYLRNPELRLASSEWQRKYVRQFDVAAVGSKLVQVYNKAIRNRRHA